jgi:hypothetical protein
MVNVIFMCYTLTQIFSVHRIFKGFNNVVILWYHCSFEKTWKVLSPRKLIGVKMFPTLRLRERIKISLCKPRGVNEVSFWCWQYGTLQIYLQFLPDQLTAFSNFCYFWSIHTLLTKLISSASITLQFTHKYHALIWNTLHAIQNAICSTHILRVHECFMLWKLATASKASRNQSAEAVMQYALMLHRSFLLYLWPLFRSIGNLNKLLKSACDASQRFE